MLSREPTEADIFNGRLDAERMRALFGALVDVEDVDHWWLCGPLGMTEDAVAVLTGLDVARNRVHRELFYVDEPPPEVHREEEAATGRPARSRSSSTAAPPAHAPARRPRPRRRAEGARRPPFACKGGVCGTCRARVTDGEITMRRNYALEDDEVAAGYVLTCQTLPVSEKVTVDFDS